MKKFLSLLLTLSVLLTMSASVFAADTDGMVDLEIKKLDTEQTYSLYKIFPLTTSVISGGIAEEGTEEGTEEPTISYSYQAFDSVYKAEIFDAITEFAKTLVDGSDLKNAADVVLGIDKDNTEYRNAFNLAVYNFMQELADESGAVKSENLGFLETLYNEIVNMNPLPTENAGDRYTIKVEALDEEEPEYVSASVKQGYYMVAQGVPDENNSRRTLFILNTAAVEANEGKLTLTPKSDAPSMDKFIIENEGQENEDKEVKATSTSMEDIVRFRLTGTLPNNLLSYDHYVYLFHDFFETDVTSGKKVFELPVGEDGKADKDSIGLVVNFIDRDGKSYDVTDKFVFRAPINLGEDEEWHEHVATNGLTGQDCDIEIGAADILAKDFISEGIEIDPEGTFEVMYDVILTTDAQLAKDCNENRAYLEYSNNPYAHGNGRTEPWTPEEGNPNDTTRDTAIQMAIVYTFQTTTDKYNENGPDKDDLKKNLLAGADFKLERLEGNEWVEVSNAARKVVKDIDDVEGVEVGPEEGTAVHFTFRGIAQGSYRLTEAATPYGYFGIDPIYFTVEVDLEDNHDPLCKVASVTAKQGTVTEGEDGTVSVNVDAGDSLFATLQEKDGTDAEGNDVLAPIGIGNAVINNPGQPLPTTGGMGTTMLYVGGAMLLVLAAGVLFFVNRKKQNA